MTTQSHSVHTKKDLDVLFLQEKFFVIGLGATASTRIEGEECFPNFISKHPQLPEFSGDRGTKKPEELLNCPNIHRAIRRLSRQFNIGIYTLKPSKKLERVCAKYNWKLLHNSFSLFSHVDSREFFLKYIDPAFNQNSHILSYAQLSPAHLYALCKANGSSLVIKSTSLSGGGKGVFFCNTKNIHSLQEDIKKRFSPLPLTPDNLHDHTFLIQPHYSGIPVSVSGCIT